MSKSSFSRRRILTGAASIAAIGAVAAPAALAAQAPLDDAQLSELIARYLQIRTRLNETNVEPGWVLPSMEWTPEELREHNVQHLTHRGFDAPQYIDLDTIEVNNRWDNPRWRFIPHEHSEVWEGSRHVSTMRMIHETAASDEEVAAGEARCAARRALYEAKLAASKEAEQRRDLARKEAGIDKDALWDEADSIEAQVIQYRPLTLAGAVAKMRFYQEYERDTFSGEFADLDWSAKMFVSALADLERIAGNQASSADDAA